MIVFITLLLMGAVIGFGMHFLLPHPFSRLHIDIVAGTAGSIIGAVISSPFAPPNEIMQKAVFLLAAIAGSILAVLIARAAKI